MDEPLRQLERDARAHLPGAAALVLRTVIRHVALAGRRLASSPTRVPWKHGAELLAVVRPPPDPARSVHEAHQRALAERLGPYGHPGAGLLELQLLDEAGSDAARKVLETIPLSAWPGPGRAR